jgi:hypothetical protein
MAATPPSLVTREALAYLAPGEGDPDPIPDTAWALAEAGPLRDCLRHWFDSLGVVEPDAAESQEVA